MIFTNLIFAGGAGKVVSSIGCIKYLEEIHALDRVRTYIGTSAGSIISFCLALGYTSKELTELVYDIGIDKTIFQFNIEEILNIMNSYGLLSGESIVDTMKKILFRKTGRYDITFLEMAKLKGKNIVICGANITKEREEFFTVDTHPNMSVITAIRISCSIPLLFAPYKMNDMLYVDGALYNNFPIDYIKNTQLKDYLGINIVEKNQSEIKNIIDYLNHLVLCVVKRINAKNYSLIDKHIITLEIDNPDIFSLDTCTLEIKKDTLDDMIDIGYQILKKNMEFYYGSLV